VTIALPGFYSGSPMRDCFFASEGMATGYIPFATRHKPELERSIICKNLSGHFLSLPL
jgi:hypothetical protein